MTIVDIRLKLRFEVALVLCLSTHKRRREVIVAHFLHHVIAKLTITNNQLMNWQLINCFIFIILFAWCLVGRSVMARVASGKEDSPESNPHSVLFGRSKNVYTVRSTYVRIKCLRDVQIGRASNVLTCFRRSMRDIHRWGRSSDV